MTVCRVSTFIRARLSGALIKSKMDSGTARAILFVICMYCGFHYGSGWAFAGAVVMFLTFL